MKVRQPFREDYKGENALPKSKESKTIPNQAISLRELEAQSLIGKTTDQPVKERLFFDIEIPRFDDYADRFAFNKHVEDLRTQAEDAQKQIDGFVKDRMKEIDEARKAGLADIKSNQKEEKSE